jgi:aminoglycoside phosphotransferase (APT) family kinase protein
MRSPNHLEIKKRCQESIPQLMAKHQLGIPTRVVVDEAGWVNPCIFVNDEFVFRFNARDPNLPKYQREKIAFELLKGTDVPVPHAVILDDSKTVAPYDVLITERLHGRNLEHDWSGLQAQQKSELAKNAGQLLTKISSVQLPFFGELSGRGPLPQTQSWFEYLSAKFAFHINESCTLGIFTEPSIQMFSAALENRQSILNEVDSAKLVHVDYHFGNLLYDDQKITGVFDFEWAFAGDPLYDYCRWTQAEEEWPGSRHAFLQGCDRDNFTKSETDRMALYQMIRNIELCVVAKLHFDEGEALSFKETTLTQASKL